MGFDWNTIGEKVSLLYKEMEYHSEYTIQQFEADLEIEKLKKVSFTDQDTFCVLRLRAALESRRSTLTKLFSFTNNLNTVDTLIEYCDYYKSHYADGGDTDSDVNRLPVSPEDMVYAAFLMMTQNNITETVIRNVWQMLVDDVGLGKFDLREPRLWPAGSLAMVIMADADLNAAVQALISSRHTYFQVSKVLVQEPIKEELLRTMANYGRNKIEVSELYVFRNPLEALGNVNGKDKLKAISVWSENIIAAKKFSSSAKIDTIWINTHGVLGAGLRSIVYTPENYAYSLRWKSSEESETATTLSKTPKTWDLFYGGKWQRPADGKYWTDHAGVSFAEATRKDLTNCANAARGAFKLWSSFKLSKRIKIIKTFVDRLRANGDSEYADIVLRFVDLPLQFGALLSVARDGDAEISTTSEPIGVVVIPSEDLKTLFVQLTIACVTGNVVILVVNSKRSVLFTPYCDMLTTCGFPPGVINSLFATQLSDLGIDKILSVGGINFIFDLEIVYDRKDKKMIPWRNLFLWVTKPKSVWLQCE